MIAIKENDWLLEEMVKMINGTDRELPITLIIEGVMVSGALVSAHKYLDHVHDTLLGKKLIPVPGATKTEDPDKLNPLGFFLGQKLKATSEDAVQKKNTLVNEVTFIHVKDAKFNAAVEPDKIKSKGVFWRGPIEKVSGFHLA